ncbi:MAG: hypothetical protein K0U68_01215, partial [Gammaproteobacteria bacterium]|nr:hypothetical protein [Gammaproteobacteria bacterium]
SVRNLNPPAFSWWLFSSFLSTLQAHGTKGNEVNVFDLIYDVCSLLYEEILGKYSGKFKFTGFFQNLLSTLLCQLRLFV